MARYERKYKFYDIPPDLVAQNVRVHPASFRKIYPDRQINNIYFDTPDLLCFHQNVNGVANRKKFRARWYGTDPTQIENPNFEIKIRTNEVGTKKIKTLEQFDLRDMRRLTRTVNEMEFSPVYLKPVLMNSYLRSYYGTADGQYRITIDYKLRYFSLLRANRFTRYAVEDFNAVVLELKYEEAIDNTTDRITQGFPFRQTKSSKYVTGVLMTNR